MSSLPRAWRAARWALPLGLLWLTACAQPEPAGRPEPELRPVVAEAIETLERRLAETRAPKEPAPGDLERRFEGLADFVLRSGGRVRDAAMDDWIALGAAAAPLAKALALDPEAPGARRSLALEFLGRAAGEEVAEVLLDLASTAPEPWLRTLAAWHLGNRQEDHVLPDLVLRLKYETDYETVLWIGWALVRHGIHSGLDGMFGVADATSDPDQRERALGEANALAAELGFANGWELRRAWDAGDSYGRLPRPRRSEAYQLALWRWLARLDEFQLRGVDDCRFLMARLDWVAAEVLSAALYDESAYVRLGAAQSLERMGPRGGAAGPALIEGLGDPRLAPQMAAALGRIGYPRARGVLEELLRPQEPLELRVAAARALGNLGLVESRSALEAAHREADDVELSQALAEARVYCGEAEPVRAELLAALTDPRLEPSTSGAALRHDLARLALAGEAGAAEVLAAWDALEAEPEAWRQRAELVAGFHAGR